MRLPQPHLRVVAPSDTERPSRAIESTRDRLAEAEDAAATREIRVLLGLLLIAALVLSQFWFVPAVRSLSKPELQPEVFAGAAGAKSCAEVPR
jgi:hypothetical protein